MEEVSSSHALPTEDAVTGSVQLQWPREVQWIRERVAELRILDWDSCLPPCVARSRVEVRAPTTAVCGRFEGLLKRRQICTTMAHSDFNSHHWNHPWKALGAIYFKWANYMHYSTPSILRKPSLTNDTDCLKLIIDSVVSTLFMKIWKHLCLSILKVTWAIMGRASNILLLWLPTRWGRHLAMNMWHDVEMTNTRD